MAIIKINIYKYMYSPNGNRSVSTNLLTKSSDFSTNLFI